MIEQLLLGFSIWLHIGLLKTRQNKQMLRSLKYQHLQFPVPSLHHVLRPPEKCPSQHKVTPATPQVINNGGGNSEALFLTIKHFLQAPQNSP